MASILGIDPESIGKVAVIKRNRDGTESVIAIVATYTAVLAVTKVERLNHGSWRGYIMHDADLAAIVGNAGE